MQQDRNDMEEKMRQLENQQLPDLSQMDEHWKTMKAALHPGSQFNIKKKKWLWFIAVLLLTGGITFFVNYNKEAAKSGLAVKQTDTLPVVNNDANPIDSVIAPVTPVAIVSKDLVTGKIVKKINTQTEANSSEISLPIRLDPKDSTLTTTGPDAKKILNELLASLAKKAQEFIIDNTRDTTLFAAEGSSLFIPAKSLGGNKRVKISLKEFYKASDIVMNKLSTTSNQEQLVTGGMVHISASVNDKPVNVLPGKAIKWYLPDTSKQMEQMELFKGEEKKAGDINWINTGQGFGRPSNIIEVRVLDLRNEPFKTIVRKKGLIGYFSIADDPEMSRQQLKQLYQEKYGYYKVRFRKGWKKTRVATELVDGLTYSDAPIGDSAWITKESADRYKLQSTQTRIRQGYSYMGLFGNGIRSVLRGGSRRPKVGEITGIKDTLSFNDNATSEFEDVSIELERKYSVNINSLGWINCDRFYNDSREKINYFVDLQDSAVNYFTMMVFNKMRSMMTGYMIGNKVQFFNVPVGEPVKIISIGVDKKGETVMAMQETQINKKGLVGLPFEPSAAPEIKSSLNKIDN